MFNFLIYLLYYKLFKNPSFIIKKYDRGQTFIVFYFYNFLFLKVLVAAQYDVLKKKRLHAVFLQNSWDVVRYI